VDSLEIKQLSMSFASGRASVVLFAELNLEVAPGGILGIVGPSGSGKTTLAKVIAGLLPATSGVVRFRGSDLISSRGAVSLMLQEGSLLPWLNLEENVALPLVLRGASRTDALSMARGKLEELGLIDSLKLRASELSGGMRQRGAFAAATIWRPKILILDEPTSALDASNRDLIMGLISSYTAETGSCSLLISHDTTFLNPLCQKVLELRGPGSQGMWTIH
jgi:NitT/TauT family transport system ATP-binding protein